MYTVYLPTTRKIGVTRIGGAAGIGVTRVGGAAGNSPGLGWG